jgi:hypothetical protein
LLEDCLTSFDGQQALLCVFTFFTPYLFTGIQGMAQIGEDLSVLF